MNNANRKGGTCSIFSYLNARPKGMSLEAYALILMIGYIVCNHCSLAFVHVPKLAEDSRLTVKQVEKGIGWLVAKGYLIPIPKATLSKAGLEGLRSNSDWAKREPDWIFWVNEA